MLKSNHMKPRFNNYPKDHLNSIPKIDQKQKIPFQTRPQFFLVYKLAHNLIKLSMPIKKKNDISTINFKPKYNKTNWKQDLWPVYFIATNVKYVQLLIHTTHLQFWIYIIFNLKHCKYEHQHFNIYLHKKKHFNIYIYNTNCISWYSEAFSY